MARDSYGKQEKNKRRINNLWGDGASLGGGTDCAPERDAQIRRSKPRQGQRKSEQGEGPL